MPSKNYDKLDQVIARARQARELREQSYRQRALKMYPWICGRCSREFTRENITELTVHHRDHNHDNNPDDGSNWELLCIYCHDNEHARYADKLKGEGYASLTGNTVVLATHQPFAGLKDLLEDDD